MNNMNYVLSAGKSSLVGNLRKIDTPFMNRQTATLKTADVEFGNLVRQGRKTVLENKAVMSNDLLSKKISTTIDGIKRNVKDGCDFMKEFLRAIFS